MLEAIGNALRIPELRRKILFTLGLFLVFRILAHIAVPGADKAALDKLFNSNAFLGLLDLFSGGGLSTFSVISMAAGTVMLMWFGELITEYGIGNGISLVILAGLLQRPPTSLVHPPPWPRPTHRSRLLPFAPLCPVPSSSPHQGQQRRRNIAI